MLSHDTIIPWKYISLTTNWIVDTWYCYMYTILAQLKASAWLYGVHQFCSQCIFVFELWKFEEVHTGAGWWKTIGFTTPIVNTEGWIQLLSKKQKLTFMRLGDMFSIQWFIYQHHMTAMSKEKTTICNSNGQLYIAQLLVQC